jgi:betaine-aldehyde dehydrogenase
MHRNAAEDLRRRQLVAATIDTIAEVGFGAATLAVIGQRAGVSAGLIAHYFDDKDGLLEATLRSLAARLSELTTARLRAARGPRERVAAVIETMLAPEEFDPRSCGVWLAFWGQVIHSPRLRRVQAVYQQRMLSNLRHALGQLVPPPEARRLAVALAAMIDGLWLRASLSSPNETDSATARAIASAFIDDAIARAVAQAAPTATGLQATVDGAVARAEAARRPWAALPGRARGAVLRAGASALGAGEPCDRAAAADCLAAVADLAGMLGDAAWGGAMPRGIVALRGGAERPLATLAGGAAPALALGNAVIAVPHPSAVGAADRLAAALSAAGLPAGLFGVLPAGAGSWDRLRSRPEVTVAVTPPGQRTMML